MVTLKTLNTQQKHFSNTMCNKCEALNRNTGKFIDVPDMPILILLVLLELLDNKAIIFNRHFSIQ